MGATSAIQNLVLIPVTAIRWLPAYDDGRGLSFGAGHWESGSFAPGDRFIYSSVIWPLASLITWPSYIWLIIIIWHSYKVNLVKEGKFPLPATRQQGKLEWGVLLLMFVGLWSYWMI